MPSVILKCPHCGRALTKSMIFDKNGKSSWRSGTCNYCRERIKWWGENNKAKIAKD